MKIIQGDRCSGKTTQAVKMAIETKSILIVRSRRLSDTLHKQNPGLKVMPIRQLRQKCITLDTYIIDDIECFFLPKNIVAITTSGEVSKRLKQFKPGRKFKKIKRLFKWKTANQQH